MDNNVDLQRNLRHHYRNLRRYIRANPEKGIAITLISGIAAGLFLSKLLK